MIPLLLSVTVTIIVSNNALEFELAPAVIGTDHPGGGGGVNGDIAREIPAVMRARAFVPSAQTGSFFFFFLSLITCAPLRGTRNYRAYLSFSTLRHLGTPNFWCIFDFTSERGEEGKNARKENILPTFFYRL